MVAPPAMQPGGYIMKAYAERTAPATPEADVRVETTGSGRLADRARVGVRRSAAQHGAQTDRFVDACAVLVPTTADAPWITMGAPGQAVEAVYWRADRERPWRLHAEGLGTMQRGEAPAA